MPSLDTVVFKKDINAWIPNLVEYICLDSVMFDETNFPGIGPLVSSTHVSSAASYKIFLPSNPLRSIVSYAPSLAVPPLSAPAITDTCQGSSIMAFTKAFEVTATSVINVSMDQPTGNPSTANFLLSHPMITRLKDVIRKQNPRYVVIVSCNY